MKIKLFVLLLLCSFLYSQTLPLDFDGNKHFNDRELYTALNLDKPYFFEFWKDSPEIEFKSAALLTQTIKNYYKFKGFFHTEASFYEKDNRIVIKIIENVPVIISDLTTISSLPISQNIPFKVGDIFDSEQFTQSKKDIKVLYGDNHYCKANLYSKAWVDIETNLAYLAYEVTPNEKCFISSIDINTSKNIDKSIIKSLLYLKEGELFSSQKIKDSYKSLYSNEGISRAIIDTRVSDSNNSVALKVDVKETDKPIRLETGLGFSTDEGLSVLLGIKHRNVLGNLKTIGLSTKLTQKKQNVKADYYMPLSLGNSLGAEFGFENEAFIGYKENRTFASIYLAQRKTPNSLKESLLLDNSNTYDSEDLSLFPEGRLFILSPKLEWNYDTRDKVLDPKKGYFLNSELMGSVESFASDASYYKFKVTAGYIHPLHSSTLAVKSSFGSLSLFSGDIPASYLFYAGGMNSNRAYNFNKLGPSNKKGDPTGFESIIETTIEYRFPLYEDFRGVIFSDNTFIGEGDTPTFSQGYHSLGLGIRYVTPIGPLAIDFGFDIENPSKNFAFHFRIGELF